MNIVILGAGTVGTSIARALCARHHNVCVVDQSKSALSEIQDRLDVHTVRGNASDPITLFQAGVASATLCLALTSSDEVNIVSASIAREMGAERSVSRIHHPSYLDTTTFNIADHFGLARLISLENLTALALAREIRVPGLLALENLAQGAVEVQEVAVQEDANATGRRLHELDFPGETLVGLITNSERTVIASADDVVSIGDRVTLIGRLGELDSVRQIFEHKPPPRQHVVIAGGGEIGFSLARVLEHRRHFHVTLIETDEERCEWLAEQLDTSTVLNADATRRSQLEEARVGTASVFVACTGHDADNIVCGVEANEMGCPRILSVVRRPDYSDVLAKVGIGQSVSPREVLAEEILAILQSGPVISRREISDGGAVVVELEVGEGAEITRAPLKELPLTRGLIATIVRSPAIWVPGGDDQLKAGDSAIVLVQSDSADEVQQLFAARQRD
ncbi:MAG TPA: Trk system potassium transporter TrkA [Planctomycetaceae bacterium]|jgi:trk system potassium uptake protein TrkA|nr:Trk system potassium transporter TrkA [Planctomycetaceae bacterium]HCK52595.1 Trk system potassium transporter TrkA [Planctomycetaceae bacterium]